MGGNGGRAREREECTKTQGDEGGKQVLGDNLELLALDDRIEEREEGWVWGDEREGRVEESIDLFVYTKKL